MLSDSEDTDGSDEYRSVHFNEEETNMTAM